LLCDFPLIPDVRLYAYVRLQVPCGHAVYGPVAARGVC
jgi:hypothetical protein